jgi:MFS family permease
LQDAASSTSSPFRDRWFVELCVARVLMMFTSPVYAACLPLLRESWAMSATEAGSIASGFQLGYALSLLVASELADRYGAKRVFVISAAANILAAAVFALFARSFVSGLVLYTIVGAAQGGSYTTAIMMIADRFVPARRGAAMGGLIASSSAGYTLSLLLTGAMLHWQGYVGAFVATCAASALGSLVILQMLRAQPNRVHARGGGAKFSGAVLRNGPAMKLIAGYTFHSWELLGMWAWAPAFVAACVMAAGAGTGAATELSSYLSALFHLLGMTASLTMGAASDRFGRRAVLIAMAGLSAACSLSFGWMIALPVFLVVIVGALYSFSAIGDSPVLSVSVTEAVPPAYLGATLAIRSLVGFGAGAISPLVFGLILDLGAEAGLGGAAWGWAFVSFGIAGVGAALCAWSLPRGRFLTRDGSSSRAS